MTTTTPGIKRLSFSELQTYYDCPFKRYLVYDKKMREQDNPYKLFGRAIDDAIGDFLVLHKPPIEVFTKVSNLLSWDDADDLTKTQLQQLASKTSKSKTGKALLEEWREIALIQLTGLFECYDSASNSLGLPGIKERVTILATQVWLNTQAQNSAFVGAVDLVGRGNSTGKSYIFDIKTAGRPWLWRDPKTRIKEKQLLLYKAHISETVQNEDKYRFLADQLQLDYDNVETYYLFLYRSKTAEMEVKKIASTTPLVTEAAKSLDGAARKILSGFKAKTSDQNTCKLCHLKDKCHAGELDDL